MKDIKDLTLGELEKTFSGIGESAYRAKQIFFWLYKKGAKDFAGMKNVPRSLIEKLAKQYYIGRFELSSVLRSKDRTEKFLFRLKDDRFIETVLISRGQRKTICLSTQVGCKFACSFCASGKTGFIRNLTPSEITSQITFLEHDSGHKLTNFVFMGMGEPLDNFENVSKAIKIMTSPDGLNIGSRRITISTCGIIPGIEKLKELELQINLSVSLHASYDKLRNELMPVNKIYPIEKLVKACKDYIGKRGRMVTLEYVLIQGKNDSIGDANKLARIAKNLHAKVNLIPCSTIRKEALEAPSKSAMNLFMNELKKKNITVTLRQSKGADIEASCGQLAGRINEA